MERNFQQQIEAMNAEHELHAARVEGRVIDSEWAVKIARSFNHDEESALGRFVDSGAIDRPELVAELITVLRRPDIDAIDRECIDALAFYFFTCNTDTEGKRPAVPNWNK